MAENFAVPEQNTDTCGFKEAVCIDAMRIYDSCSDKDCLEDVRVLFPGSVQEAINQATSVRIRSARVITVFIDLQPIPFNRGFYSVDMTFYLGVGLDVFNGPTGAMFPVKGLSVFNKKVILFGSEGSVKVFSSQNAGDEISLESRRTMPKATVQVAEPIALSAKLCEGPVLSGEPLVRVPDQVRAVYGEDFASPGQGRSVFATIGLFTIVQIVRNVQMLVPAYDFCIPKKECTPSSDDPCELFSRIEFPTEEFFPPRAGQGEPTCTGSVVTP